MSLEFTLVRRAISLAVIDGPDTGDNPDILKAQGSVLFEPVIKKGDSIQVQTRGGSQTYALAPIECPINDGIISHRGQDGVKLPAGGEAANPSLIRWKATFSRMQAGGKSFTLAPVIFDAVPGGEIDLTMVAPVAGAPEGVVRGPRGTSLESIIVDGSELVFTAVDDAGSFEIARIPLDEMVRAEADAAADGVRDALAVDVAASQSARDAAEGHANRAATSESNAKTSETNAKQSETNAGDYAAVATTAATEAVDAMERATDLAGGDFATHEYVDSKAWIKRALTTGEDLNTVVGPGVHSFNTYKVSSSLLNTPSNWVPQPGWLEVFNSGQVIFQKLYVWDSNFISSWERVRLGTAWQPWTQTMYRGAPPTPPAPKTWAQTDDVIFWGDSLVDGGDTNGQWATGENLPGQLSTHLSNEVVNRGRSGQTSNEILIRSGAVEIWGTPVGGKTVPGGHVDIVVNGQTPLSRTGRTFAATWGGASGTLKSKGAGWEFYQPSGAAATITSPTKVNATQAFPHENSAHIFLMGENDFWTGDLAPDGDIVDHVVANYQRAVESIPEDPVRHVLIGGVKCRADTVKGDERYRQVKEINRRLAALFPANFVDREAWLSSRALDAAGITPTESDLEAMAANITPPSAFASGDNLHIRKEVASAEARELWLPALIHRGWAQARDGVSVPAPFNTFSVDLWANRDDLDSKSDKGHVHTADQITDLHHYRGTGSPEGKVAAPVGSVYTDTAATNGAIRWIKTSGTGTTGWRVEYGDTALRNISSLIANAAGKLSISRVGSTVFLNGQNIIPSSDLTSGSTFINSLPLGFRPMERRDFTLAATLGSSTSRSAFQFATGAIGVWLPSVSDKYSFQLSWQTSDAWPTTLPGTPA